MKKTGRFVMQSDLAVMLGITEGRISQLIKAGRIVREETGKNAGFIDLDNSQNIAFFEVRASGKRTAPKRSDRPQIPRGFVNPEEEEKQEDEEDDLRSIPGARLAKLRADIEFRKIEIAERMGQLIDRKIVESRMGAILQAAAFFTEIPVKLALRVSDMTGRPELRIEIENLISAEISHALENLKRAALSTCNAGKNRDLMKAEEIQKEASK